MWAVGVASGMALLLGLQCAHAQMRAPTVHVNDPQSAHDQEWMKSLAIDPESSAARAYAEHQARRAAAERELRQLRIRHFGAIRNTAVRQEGILKLRTYNDPALFPLMLDIYQREGVDVRTALLDHFHDAANDEGDTALAWTAIMDQDEKIRALATQRLTSRMGRSQGATTRVKYAIYEGFRGQSNQNRISAATLAMNLNLIDVIPWLINSQVTGAPRQQVTSTGGAGSPQGALAWIMVGQQTAFVSDLQPVVGNNAVAFDPQLSVINTGTLIRVIDAAVVTYHIDIHNILVDWTTREWGDATGPLGYNIPAWRQWYTERFIPDLAKREADRKAAEALAREVADRP
jgi:hypothetical protein